MFKKIKIPPIVKKECNIEGLKHYIIWPNIILTKKNTSINIKLTKKKIKTKKNLIINNNKIKINKWIFLYYGDMWKNKKIYSIFINKNNHKILFLTTNEKFPDTNATIISNTSKKITIKFNKKIYTFKKFYINIKEYQKKGTK